MMAGKMHRTLTRSTGTRVGDFSVGALGMHLIAPQTALGTVLGAGTLGVLGGVIGIVVVCAWAYSVREK